MVSFYSTMISGFSLNLIRTRPYKLKWIEKARIILQVTLDLLYIKHPNIHFHSVPGTCGTCMKRLDPKRIHNLLHQSFQTGYQIPPLWAVRTSMAASDASGFAWQQHYTPAGWVDSCFSCHVSKWSGEPLVIFFMYITHWCFMEFNSTAWIPMLLFVDSCRTLASNNLPTSLAASKRNWPQVAWKNPTLPLSKDTLALKKA